MCLLYYRHQATGFHMLPEFPIFFKITIESLGQTPEFLNVETSMLAIGPSGLVISESDSSCRH
jgi:hypothetical protein